MAAEKQESEAQPSPPAPAALPQSSPADPGKQTAGENTEAEPVQNVPLTYDGVCALYSVYDLANKYFDPKKIINSGTIFMTDPGCDLNLSKNTKADMHLFYLQNVIYSALIPDIRFFKVIRGEKPKDKPYSIADIEDVVEVQFPRSLSHAIPLTKEERKERYSPTGDGGESLTVIGTYTDFELSRPILDREGEIGVSSFEWSFVGNNPFTADKDIQATLKLKMNGMGALFVPRRNSGGYTYSISDILIQADCFKSSETSSPQEEDKQQIPTTDPSLPLEYRSECYEIFVEAGYRLDKVLLSNILSEKKLKDFSFISTDKEYEDILESIEQINFDKFKTCMYLSVADHKFDIKEDGTVSLEINYNGRSSQYLKTYDMLRGEGPDEPINLSEIIRILYNRKKVFKLGFTTEAKNAFASEGKIEELREGAQFTTACDDPVAPSSTTQSQDTVEQAPPLEPPPTEAGKTEEKQIDVMDVPFFFYGDLLDAVITYSGADKYKDFRLVLGEAELNDIIKPENKNKISIASIPVSMTMWQNFVTKFVIGEDKTSMSITKFNEIFMNHILPESLGLQCRDYQTQADTETPRERIRFLTPAPVFTHFPIGTVKDPVKEAKDDKSGYIKCDFMTGIKDYACDMITNYDAYDKRAIKNASPISIYVIQQQRSSYIQKGLGDLISDFDRKIPHFSYGKSYGLIKKVSLQKSDIPYYRESRMTNIEGKNRFTQLTNVYDATFEMIGNNLLSLGGYVYLDPNSLAPSGILGYPNEIGSLSYILGLGGAYLVTKISNTLTPGNYVTSVKTKWENRGTLKKKSGDPK